MKTALCSSAKVISIHAPTRGATFFLCHFLHLCHHFNPRSHERSDKYVTKDICADLKDFNPRSHERSDYLLRLVDFSEVYFNPRSHERSDVATKTINSFLDISIHAPTRGATVQRCGEWLQVVISIHAPTRGATLTRWVLIWDPSNFNPRSHERSDASSIREYEINFISIHAPTRGATGKGWYAEVKCIEFQSTLPREERLSGLS